MTADFQKLQMQLRSGLPTTWLRRRGAPSRAPGLTADEISSVERRFARFAQPLSCLFPEAQWNGEVRSPLLPYRSDSEGRGKVWIKADHLLPMTGSVKARGGVHELLCVIEQFALEQGLMRSEEDTEALLEPQKRRALGDLQVIVASTGNLGFSVGLVARAFGVSVEVHMSSDAKAWKKKRLRDLGASVVEHPGDYSEAVAAARRTAAERRAYFVDDERSQRLFAGYSAAGRELAGQLEEQGIEIGPGQPLVVYLPCGVGGAPGGISAGLVRQFGDHVTLVFVEPIASACMLVALASGEHRPVYDFGLDNNTIADGLAVPLASPLALQLMGDRIDAVVALPDRMLLGGVRQAWHTAQLRLEPSAAAAIVAIEPFLEARERGGDPFREAVHVAWATGGGLLPDSEFLPLLQE